jgi:hypothetical protein
MLIPPASAGKPPGRLYSLAGQQRRFRGQMRKEQRILARVGTTHLRALAIVTRPASDAAGRRLVHVRLETGRADPRMRFLRHGRANE